MNNFCLIKNKNNKHDITGYGSIDYNFLISQSFISCESYVNFLNSAYIRTKELNLYNQDIAKIIDLNKTIYTLKPHISPESPIHYINLDNLKIYCNFLNDPNLKTIHTYPYDIENNLFDKHRAKYWIPNYNEWYKATYYNYQNEQYYTFPNSSDNIEDCHVLTNNKTNSHSPYGLINAGLKFFTIIDDQNTGLDYLIAGGSSNRHPMHSKAGVKYYVSKEYRSNYISPRICKKSETKEYTLKLYDTFGDGWGGNYIIINDANHRPITDKLYIEHGYGPLTIKLEIDRVDKNFNIRYYKHNNLSYENHYELYSSDDLIFASNMYETPPSNTIIPIT